MKDSFEVFYSSLDVYAQLVLEVLNFPSLKIFGPSIVGMCKVYLIKLNNFLLIVFIKAVNYLNHFCTYLCHGRNAKQKYLVRNVGTSWS